MSCALYKRISYALAAPGAVDDPGNSADTPETIAQIVEHNRTLTTVCGGRP